MLKRILDRRQADLLTADGGLLGDLRVAQARFDAPPEDQNRLAQSVAQLDELFLLVVMGEFNAGKSAFIPGAHPRVGQEGRLSPGPGARVSLPPA